jgi:hypothetical protein
MLLSIVVLTLTATGIAPADWVPMRWPSSDPKSLELLQDHPVNCLIIEKSDWNAELAKQIKARQLVALIGTGKPGEYASEDGAHKILMTPRHLLQTDQPVAVTNQGVWPGVRAEEEGKTHNAASGTAWIDTNAGYLRYARAAVKPGTTIWIANQPLAKTIFPLERYLAAIGDAAMTGTRWVVAFDDDFNKRLFSGEAKTVKQWKRIGELLRFYESHKEWRDAQAYSKLAVVQSPGSGALVSGGVLDMIAVKHTPVKPVPSAAVDGKTMKDAQLAVNVDPDSMNAEQKSALKDFTGRGGTLLTGPPGWKFPDLKPGQITLSKEDLEKLDQIWKEMNSMIGRRNMGARLFNVATMLSNMQITADGKKVLLHLVNYADFPVENVAVHLLGKYKTAYLHLPEKPEPIKMELYDADEGCGLDIDAVKSVGTLVLEL